MSARRSQFSLFAWFPLVAALAAAAGAAHAAASALLLGPGGFFSSPVTEPILATPASWARDVHRARAPDAQGRRRVV
jgi:hypothetical protein